METWNTGWLVTMEFESFMGMYVVRPKKNLEKHIIILESLVAHDKKYSDTKSLKYHQQALDELKNKMV
ncbi:MAG: hypothetical protein RSF87_12470 [Cellulosilyticaceae bacterium]